jgi:deazaflavin-dependent oxidoreductase (nitroreductase family)
MARFNRHVTNRLTLPLAGGLPYFAIIVHEGRRSGRRYRTPVNVFRVRDGFRIALTYGSDTGWVRNALSAGAIDLITRRRRYRLVDPQFVHDERQRYVPWPMRAMLRLVRVTEFLQFRVAD